MTETAIKMPIGNLAGWVETAVANPIRDAGGQPVSRGALERMTGLRVGATADTDGYTVAKANGEPDHRGRELIISEVLRRLREQGWVSGDDGALTWTGPDGSLELVIGGRKIRLPSAGERTDSRRRHLVDMMARGQTDPVPVLVIGSRGGTEVMKLAPHRLSLVIPPMSREDLDRLYSDITEHGVREPLWLYEGKVLDGRHRLAVAHLTEQPVRVRVFDGDEIGARALVFSANVARRHLNSAQFARLNLTLFASIAKDQAREALREGGAMGGKAPATLREPSANGKPPTPESNIASRPGSQKVVKPERGGWEDRASRMGGGVVSPRTLRKLDDARLDEAPDTAAKVESGEIKTVTAAADAAAKERGVALPGPVWVGRGTLITHARYDLRRFLVEERGPNEKMTPRDMLAVISEIRQLCDQAEETLRHES